ncbi:hypothetical protein GCK32_012633, partial [Trichostrongylus colubriformis]
YWFQKYGPRTRNAIINDAFAVAAVNRLDYVTVLRLLEYLKHEKRYVRKLLKPLYEERFFQDVTEHYKDDNRFQDR